MAMRQQLISTIGYLTESTQDAQTHRGKRARERERDTHKQSQASLWAFTQVI